VRSKEVTCTRCGDCTRICPVSTRKVTGKMTAEAKIDKEKPDWMESKIWSHHTIGERDDRV
jgi:ferredoxin